MQPVRGIRVTWLGHATLLVQMEGINILTDPMFSTCCGPLNLPLVPKRQRKVPCSIAELPRIDAVIISHNHFDHLDYSSVQQLNKQFGRELVWFVPQRLKPWMISSHCINVVELNWWQEAFLYSPVKKKYVTFVFTPAQHWSKRGINDDNTVCLFHMLCSLLLTLVHTLTL